MTTSKFTTLALAAAVLLLFADIKVTAQSSTTSVLATGLKAPTKIIVSPKGNLLVGEAGSGPNSGRISIIDSVTGNRRTLGRTDARRGRGGERTGNRQRIFVHRAI